MFGVKLDILAGDTGDVNAMNFDGDIVGGYFRRGGR